MSNNKTIDFYNQNAEEYFSKTVSVDMSDNCDRFLKHIKPGGEIIDIGAGSGRDMLYFLKRGYSVESIDASAELCRLASVYTGVSVQCIKIQSWMPAKKYAGVWANASLVHLKADEVRKFIGKISGFMEDDGAAYISVKSGIATGEDPSGRYFTDLPEDWMHRILSENSDLYIADEWITVDKLDRSGFHWVNIILQKSTK